MTNRDSFIFYRSFFDALIDMDKESQADCLMAIADYALNGKEPKMTPAVRMFFTLVKPQLDANQKKYESGCKGAGFGKFGGRPKKNPKETPEKPQENPKETPNDNDNVNVNDNDNVNVNDNDNDNVSKEKCLKEKPFRPSIDEVKQYCLERNNSVDPERWFDFYSSNGWKVGKNPMRDWKACVRNWEKSDKNKKSLSKYDEINKHNYEFLKKVYEKENNDANNSVF